ncbi:MAG: penicillin-binding protein 1A [Gemmatimonadaceae bacterium]
MPRFSFSDFRHRFVAALRPDPARPARRWARELWLPLALLAAAVAGVTTLDTWLYTCGFAGCPAPSEIRTFRPAEGGKIVDRNGLLIARLTAVRRVNVPLQHVPVHVRQAFVATEDRRFYAHNGLDWRGLFRAAARNVGSLGVREGFSTITMQVARNTFVARYFSDFSERSLRRKLIELRVARLIERNLTKDQILELYLNVIYLGNGVYGVEAASRDLFGKSVDRLTLAEGAVLAALPKGPSAYTPRNSPRRALQRRNLVLSLMVREGYVPRARAQAAVGQPIVVAREEWRPVQPNDSYAVDAVRQLVDSVLGKQRAEELGNATVYTTLDLRAQAAADRAVRRRADAIARESAGWYGARGGLQGAMVAVDPRTGDIRALVGGRTFERGSFNRATDAHRQPGSAFKPFVYAAALASGMTPATMVDDEPVEITNGAGVWAPTNFGDEYLGRVTLRRALERSANAATVRVSRAVGEPRVVAVAHANGIASEIPAVPSIALGAVDVTPLELVTAYSPFANGGYRVRPRLVRRIEAADGTALWSQETATPVRVMDPRDAYQLTSMLRAVVDYGTARTVRDLGVHGRVAGKTGTTNNGTDVWFVGYTPSLVAGFWFGYDSPRAISGDASGGRLAAPAWADFYAAGWREPAASADAWQPPPGMEMRVIDAVTGELAGEFCPITQQEWFKPGTAPRTPCREHEMPEEMMDENHERGWMNDITDRVSDALKKVFKF